MYNNYVKSNYRIKARSKKKNKAAILILLTAMLILIFILFSSGGATTVEKYETVIVRAGDTLWGIAKSNLPSGMDIREYIYVIKKANNITGSIIYPGQELKLPL